MQAKAKALERWEEAKGGQPERLVSGAPCAASERARAAADVPSPRISLSRREHRLNPRRPLTAGSDDFTLFLWNPSEAKAPLARMTGALACVTLRKRPLHPLTASVECRRTPFSGLTLIRIQIRDMPHFSCFPAGHMQVINHVAFSPNGRLVRRPAPFHFLAISTARRNGSRLFIA